MKFAFIPLFASFVFVFALSGEVVKENEEVYTLSGNKFEGGERVRYEIRFEGVKGILQSKVGMDVNELPIRFSRMQTYEEFDVEFVDGKKMGASFEMVDDYTEGEWGKGKNLNLSAKTSPLRGWSMRGKDVNGKWEYTMLHKSPTAEQRVELESMIYHEKAPMPVTAKVGESWTRTPNFINAYLRRELRNVVGAALFTLSEVKVIDGEKCAVLAVSIDSSGDEVQDDGTVTQARMSMKGTTIVSLETFLRKSIELRGDMSGLLARNGVSHSYEIPIKIVATESYSESFGF